MHRLSALGAFLCILGISTIAHAAPSPGRVVELKTITYQSAADRVESAETVNPYRVPAAASTTRLEARAVVAVVAESEPVTGRLPLASGFAQ